MLTCKLHHQARYLLQHVHAEFRSDSDVYSIGTFYNALWRIMPFPDPAQQATVAEWAKEAYPVQWEELQKKGTYVDEDFDLEYFNIDRSIEA